MPRINIECPQTGETVATPIATSEARFEQESFSGELEDCPECGGSHEWDDEDAFLA